MKKVKLFVIRNQILFGFYFDRKSTIASITALTHNFWMAAFLPYWEDYRNQMAIFFIIGFNWFFKCLLLGVLMVVGLQQMMIYRYSGINLNFMWELIFYFLLFHILHGITLYHFQWYQFVVWMYAAIHVQLYHFARVNYDPRRYSNTLYYHMTTLYTV